MVEKLKNIIEEILLWDSTEVQLKYLKEGLTNQNYIIEKDNVKYAVRLCNKAAYAFQINRKAEYAAMKAAEEIGIGAEIVYFSIETGDMITKFIHGTTWTNEDASTTENISRIAHTLRKVHALPPIPYEFSPYQDIEDRIRYAQRNSLALPDNLKLFQKKLYGIREQSSSERNKIMGLCHNDPFPNNFMDDGSVRLIDWEFAGMGDIYFDLACISTFYTQQNRVNLLEQYFGQCDTEKLNALENQLFVVQFWNAMWAVLQTKLGNSPQRYEAMAEAIFANMMKQI
jgi:Predicted choline kinase involved in LPS biosynthesis